MTIQPVARLVPPPQGRYCRPMDLNTLENLVANYGYIAVAVGTFIEGETFLLLGGFTAHQGYLSLPLVMLCALAGSLGGDLTSFFLGRFRGRAMLAKHPKWQRAADRAQTMFHGRRVPIILLFRFLWGMRIIIPLTLGATGTRLALFAPLSAISALAWSVAGALLGYSLSNAVQSLLDHVERYELWALGIILGLGLIIWFFRAQISRLFRR